MKKCVRCKFRVSKTASSYCRPCLSAKTGEWQIKNYERYKANARKIALRYKFGITPEQYDELVRDQNGCCGVCQRPASEFKTRLAVDHDHKTGLIRGVLCYICNRHIVGRNTDPSIFDAAASYLRRPRKGWIVPPKRKRKRRKKFTRHKKYNTARA